MSECEGPAKLEVELAPVEELVLDDGNVNEGDVASLVESFREFGQHENLVVSRADNRVLIGNHRLKAARELGWVWINVVYVDDTDVVATRRAIADNATGRRAKWLEDKLLEKLDNVGYDIPGLDGGEVDRIIKKVNKRNEAPEAKPHFPIVARFGERYDYITIIADTDTEVAWLESLFEFPTKSSPDNQDKVGRSRVLTVTEAQQYVNRRIRLFGGRLPEDET